MITPPAGVDPQMKRMLLTQPIRCWSFPTGHARRRPIDQAKVAASAVGSARSGVERRYWAYETTELLPYEGMERLVDPRRTPEQPSSESQNALDGLNFFMADV